MKGLWGFFLQVRKYIFKDCIILLKPFFRTLRCDLQVYVMARETIKTNAMVSYHFDTQGGLINSQPQPMH